MDGEAVASLVITARFTVLMAGIRAVLRTDLGGWFHY